MLPQSGFRLTADSLQRLALVGCLFILAGFGAWRVDTITNAPAMAELEAASLDERRLTSLIDTIAGDGQSEVRLALRANDSWSILVLINADARANVPKEINGGKRKAEPTRYGDWEKDGRTYDFS